MAKRILQFTLLLFATSAVYAQDLRSDTIGVGAYQMHLDFTHFSPPKILIADVSVGIKAKMNNVTGIRFDLLLLTVDSVKINGQNNSFGYNDSTLSIPFNTALNTGDSATLEMWYHGTPHQQLGDFGGFFWDDNYAFNIGVSFYNNPPNYGRVWFPCFDNFLSRSYFEYYVTTKNSQKAFCNGLLLDSSSTASTNTWHWKLDGNIPSYLASVAISDYLTLTDTVQGMRGTTPIALAVRAVDTAAFNIVFRHLHNAFHIHEGHWGYYRWDRVGYCIVDYTRGAMEHATNISFMQPFLYAYPNAEEYMAHELSHHWFGDLVTTNSAAEMWLNEGWATYNQKLFLQSLYGDSTYEEQIRLNHQMVLDQAAVNDGAYLPVSGVPFANTYGTTVYYKGMDMIHTLRYYMGDSLFFHCLQNYLTNFSYQTVTTQDMSDFLTQCSGISNLPDFFNDWINQPGFTHFSIERSQVISSGNGNNVQLVIRQRLSHALSYFNNVPVVVSYFDINGNRTDETVNVSGPCTSHASQTLATEPVYIVVDFDQKLQDAITDEWRMVADTGNVDFGTAEMTMEVNSFTDSNLIRVEHNWIRPEPMVNKIPGLHLHNMRYWTVDGIIHPGFNATATINYTAVDPSLDKTFITNSEDSLVMMYRANDDSEWVFVDSFTVDTGVSSTDGVGSIAIYNVQKGQYSMAIWNSSLPDTTTPDAPCIYTVNSITDIDKGKNGFALFPNPANQNVTVSFDPNNFERLELYNVVGIKIWEQKIAPGQNTIELNLDKFAAGYYLVTLTNMQGGRGTKNLIKE